MKPLINSWSYKNYRNRIKKVYLCLLRIFNTDILKYNKLLKNRYTIKLNKLCKIKNMNTYYSKVDVYLNLILK